MKLQGVKVNQSTYIMKIMGFDCKKIRSSSFRDKQKNAESQDLE